MVQQAMRVFETFAAFARHSRMRVMRTVGGVLEMRMKMQPVHFVRDRQEGGREHSGDGSQADEYARTEFHRASMILRPTHDTAKPAASRATTIWPGGKS